MMSEQRKVIEETRRESAAGRDTRSGRRVGKLMPRIMSGLYPPKRGANSAL